MVGCKGKYLKKVVLCGKVSNQPVGDNGSFPRAEAGITVQNIVVNEKKVGLEGETTSGEILH